MKLEIRIIKELERLIRKDPDPIEEGSPIWELLRIIDFVIKYPNEDSQFKNRRWTEDWKEYTEEDILAVKSHYDILPIEPLEQGDADFILITMDDINRELRSIGVDFYNNVYSIDLEKFPKEKLQEISELETFEQRVDYFNNWGLKLVLYKI